MSFKTGSGKLIEELFDNARKQKQQREEAVAQNIQYSLYS